ncbi:MAG TPA: arsenate reductase ArsC [Flexilinea sp.]|nr:arsenate reductase ArsC [Flexilinea sp.]HPJ66120.1 arsenate reductase ArsC [Flexilinea sp.]HPR70801.1 arsenate reductase ArsC [Flexilinea sp.]
MMRVLFVCVHKSARSQIAEAYLNQLGQGNFLAESAGLEPATIYPPVIKVLKEDGIDISGKKTASVFKYFQEGRRYDMVITVCDQANSEKCPVFPSSGLNLHWSFPDPTTFQGSEEEKTEQIRWLRDEIKHRIEEFIHVMGQDKISTRSGK